MTDLAPLRYDCEAAVRAQIERASLAHSVHCLMRWLASWPR